MIRSMMSFTELPLSFWSYALETAARFLNIAPSKTVAQTPYQIWHDKPASYKYLRVWGSPAYVKRLVANKLDSRSARVPQPPERYGFLGMTGQLDNGPKTYGEAMSDIDPGKWLEAMKSEMDSMSSNQVWTLVDRAKSIRPVGCKWVYKPLEVVRSNDEVAVHGGNMVVERPHQGYRQERKSNRIQQGSRLLPRSFAPKLQGNALVRYSKSFSHINSNDGSFSKANEEQDYKENIEEVVSCNVLHGDQGMHKLVFNDGGLPDGTKLAYFAHGQALKLD
ncbi:UNVERIFIED_CONTAM: hypothetical protein Scaly_3007200 [Sesamum calycinum]|uniref:Uncharacterized protein n=1 Tax=Sesamum calycinum TaxID=2727403 RepID=A0AAW2KEM3_9LAMI